MAFGKQKQPSLNQTSSLQEDSDIDDQGFSKKQIQQVLTVSTTDVGEVVPVGINEELGCVFGYTPADGECGYNVLDSTREDAYGFLLNEVDNNQTIRDRLSLAVKEQLLEDGFYTYLVNTLGENNNTLKQLLLNAYTAFNDAQEKHSEEVDAKREQLYTFAKEPAIVKAYLAYDILEKRVDSGYAHAAVLLSLKKIRLWQIQKDPITNKYGRPVHHPIYERCPDAWIDDKDSLDIVYFAEAKHYTKIVFLTPEEIKQRSDNNNGIENTIVVQSPVTGIETLSPGAQDQKFKTPDASPLNGNNKDANKESFAQEEYEIKPVNRAGLNISLPSFYQLDQQPLSSNTNPFATQAIKMNLSAVGGGQQEPVKKPVGLLPYDYDTLLSTTPILQVPVAYVNAIPEAKEPSQNQKNVESNPYVFFPKRKKPPIGSLAIAFGLIIGGIAGLGVAGTISIPTALLLTLIAEPAMVIGLGALLGLILFATVGFAIGTSAGFVAHVVMKQLWNRFSNDEEQNPLLHVPKALPAGTMVQPGQEDDADKIFKSTK